MNLQPTLENDYVRIRPLKTEDFETLFSLASDPLVWEQHPQFDRYKREVFEKFFESAIESKGAFLVLDAKTGDAIGSSRYYELDEKASVVLIGYTFLARSHWGGMYNHALKTLMLNHAFASVNAVLFHIGESNLRSQKAIEKLGAVRTGISSEQYPNERPSDHIIYEMTKMRWMK